MIVHVRLFAQLRERAGSDRMELELSDGASVADALAELSSLVAAMPVVTAVNRTYVAADTPLHTGDELALIPPVSGGGPPHVRITPEALSAQALTERVRHPGAGAVVSFAGVTREVASLEYEAYAEMATEQITQIAVSAQERHGLLGVAVEHRVGSVALSEPSVVVAVSAAHREQAFAGAREIIDELKARAPIWKKEMREGGRAVWVPGTSPGG